MKARVRAEVKARVRPEVKAKVTLLRGEDTLNCTLRMAMAMEMAVLAMAMAVLAMEMAVLAMEMATAMVVSVLVTATR